MQSSAFLLRPLAALICGAVIALAGCGDTTRQSYATETDEPLYRQGEQMKRGNRHQEALSSYLKVIEKRGDDAPESHLEAGLLYLHHIRDPIAAVYHFRKYLALRPNSTTAPQVRQRIDAAIRDFARTLPAQPLENQLQRVDLIAAMDKLKLENDLLKRQIAELQAQGGAAADPAPADSGSPAPRAPNPSFNLSVEMPTVRTRPKSTEPARPPAGTAKSTVQPAPPAATNSRRHVVRAGDTLMKLALEYYGDRARWRDIFAANRAVMRSESDMKIGTQLVIPP